MTREEVLADLNHNLDESASCLERNFGPAAFGVVSLHNQMACLHALTYLVSHQSEQAWRNAPPYEVMKVSDDGCDLSGIRPPVSQQ